MTWDARDIALPMLPLPAEPRLPQAPVAPLAMVPPALLLDDEAPVSLSCADREAMRQAGMIPDEVWEAWRTLATRGIDGIV